MTNNITPKKPRKIFVIGNSAGGKTRLSRKLADMYSLPLTHVDSIQFLPGLQMRPFEQSKQMILKIMNQDSWIIDGYGPLDILEERFRQADRIVFIDLPLPIHMWWFFKRQIRNFWSRRPELPLGGSELSIRHTKKVLQTMRSQHRQMRPEVIRILSLPEFSQKVVRITNRKEWARIYEEGLDEKISE